MVAGPEYYTRLRSESSSQWSNAHSRSTLTACTRRSLAVSSLARGKGGAHSATTTENPTCNTWQNGISNQPAKERRTGEPRYSEMSKSVSGARAVKPEVAIPQCARPLAYKSTCTSIQLLERPGTGWASTSTSTIKSGHTRPSTIRHQPQSTAE